MQRTSVTTTFSRRLERAMDRDERLELHAVLREIKIAAQHLEQFLSQELPERS